MKVCFFRFGSICEPDIIDAFIELGFEIIEYKRAMEYKQEVPSKSMKMYSEFLQNNPVDVVFSINYFPYVSEVCQVYHLTYLAWIVDSPVMELYSKSVRNSCNRIFIFDRATYEDVRAFNENRIFHLPLGADVKTKEVLFAKVSEDDRKRFSHDVSFVGSLYSEKCPFNRAKKIPEYTEGYLNGIMDAQVKVYGYYFIEELINDKVIDDFISSIDEFYRYPGESFLTDRRILAQLYIGNKVTALERKATFRRLSEIFDTYIYTASDTSEYPKLHNMGVANSRTEMPLIFNFSKININTTSKPIRTGLPLRIFDIMSSGGFCLSNYQEEIPELFVPNEDIVMYGSMDEMIELCGYYLEHEKERIEIAYNGFEKIKNNFTFVRQLEKLLKTAFSI